MLVWKCLYFALGAARWLSWMCWWLGHWPPASSPELRSWLAVWLAPVPVGWRFCLIGCFLVSCRITMCLGVRFCLASAWVSPGARESCLATVWETLPPHLSPSSACCWGLSAAIRAAHFSLCFIPFTCLSVSLVYFLFSSLNLCFQRCLLHPLNFFIPFISHF